MIFSSSAIVVPNFPLNAFDKMDFFKKVLLSSVKDYHKADVNLFWEDIRINSIDRSKAYLNEL